MGTENKKDEGIRSFTRAIDHLNFGSTQVELSEELHDLTTRMLAHAKKCGREVKGKMVVSLDLLCNGHGELLIQASSKSALAKPKGETSHAWVTASGNVTFQNPRQTELPLREITMDDDPIRDLDDEERQGEENGTE